MSRSSFPALIAAVAVVAAACATWGLYAPRARLSSRTAVSGNCSASPLVDQVVLIVVDALRPDFAVSRLSQFTADRGGVCGELGELQEHNRYSGPTLSYIEDALVDAAAGRHHRPTLGAYFVADAPTTTSQRLTALMTGIVPALVEASSNFNSDAVEVDSLLHHLAGRSVVLGDDTWLQLFPQTAEAPVWKSYAVFPSFEVDDLHTNDDGVVRVLHETLLQEDPGSVLEAAAGSEPARLVLAHFLGVDHAGHTYHARHTEMENKLAQLNIVLRNVSQTLSARSQKHATTKTLLLVVGDHGMTNSGDHGGSSPQETDSFLFAEVYGGTLTTTEAQVSANRLVARRWSACASNCAGDLCRLKACADTAATRGSAPISQLSAFRQVDLVPTLSFLFGLPIPFSSTGRWIPELVALVERPSSNEDIEALERTWCNAEQLLRLGETGLGGSAAESITFADLCTMSAAALASSTEVRWVFVALGFTVCTIATLQLLIATVRRVIDKRMVWSPLGASTLALVIACIVGRCIVPFSNSLTVTEDTLSCSIAAVALLWRASMLKGQHLGSVAAVLVCRLVYAQTTLHRSHGTHTISDTSAFAALSMHLSQWSSWSLPCVNLLRRAVFAVVAQRLSDKRLHITVNSPAKRLRGQSLTWMLWTLFWEFLRQGAGGVVASAALGATAMFLGKNENKKQLTVWLAVLAMSHLAAASHRDGALGWATSTELHFLMILWLISSDCRGDRRSPLAFLGAAVVLEAVTSAAFFAQGQQCVFRTIDWSASTADSAVAWLPYVFSKSHVWKGVLVFCRTFAAQLTTAAVVRSTVPSGRRSTAPLLITQTLLLCSSAQLVCSLIASWVLRRHLMVVEIFAPKLFFDVCAAGALSIGLLVFG